MDECKHTQSKMQERRVLEDKTQWPQLYQRACLPNYLRENHLRESSGWGLL